MPEARPDERPDDQPPLRVLVTGGAGGIGGALAGALRSSGCAVVVADRVEVDVPRSVVVDLTSRAGNLAAVEAAVDHLGGLDAVVPCAGAQVLASVEDFDEDAWDTLLSLMLTSPFLLAKHAWPHLVRSGRGRVVAMASAHSHVGAPRKAAYVAAKHGLLGLVKVLAADGAPHGIGAVAVCPGYVDSPMTRGRVETIVRAEGCSHAEAEASFVAGTHQVPRMVAVADVVRCVELALGATGLALTGTSLTPDLGWTAH